MIKSIKLLSMIALLGILIGYTGCRDKKGAEKPIQEVQLEKLSKTWKLTSVTLDGTSRNAEYGVGGANPFSLTITGEPTNSSYNYTTASRPALSPWKSNGSWIYGTDPATQIVRDADSAVDKLDLTYSVSDTQLSITFNFAANGYTNTGRADVVRGAWVFTFGL